MQGKDPNFENRDVALGPAKFIHNLGETHNLVYTELDNVNRPLE
jgi:hypothetical protein